MLAISSGFAFAERYQAIDATLGGDATINGNYVQMKGGSLSFAVSAQSKGMHELVVRYMQDYDEKKEQNLVVNSNNVGNLVFPRTATWTDLKSVVSLNAGSNTVAITNNWGWVDIQYIEINPHENTPFNLDKNLVNPNANEAAKKVFAFMQEKFQKKVISGVMTEAVLSGNNAVTLNNQEEVSFIRQSSSNKTPALVGFDFMHATGKEMEEAGTTGNWFKNYTNATVSLATELFQRGGIPAYCWHWRDPLKNDKGFYSPSADGSDKTNFDLTTACTNSSCTAWNTNSTAYNKMVEDIDIVADYLKELQNSGVAVLWRPVHEASGGWFWWGGKGAAAYKLLYKLIFERLTTHHGLNNLIWVWDSQGGGDPDWYPGDNYVDIIGRDFYYYPPEKNHASLIGEFEALKNAFGTAKMIALTENGSIPYPENLIDDGAGWSYFMPWYREWTNSSTHNVASDWNNIMNHEYVITLEDMPGWGNYTPPSSSSGASSSSSSETTSSSSGTTASSSSSEESTPILTQTSIVRALRATPQQYYNLKGEPLGTQKPTVPGIYLVKNNRTGQVQKIAVR
uniref:Mannan endo-1,4-beta-mannosidase n=1 Tax=uncultured bacterium contig00188 TaxID=1181603 RepID=A0A806KID7_9BACT|nr:mannan endo-1,4-beta-mannosidase [uncultured bacterium contig00188]